MSTVKLTKKEQEDLFFILLDAENNPVFKKRKKEFQALINKLNVKTWFEVITEETFDENGELDSQGSEICFSLESALGKLKKAKKTFKGAYIQKYRNHENEKGIFGGGFYPIKFSKKEKEIINNFK